MHAGTNDVHENAWVTDVVKRIIDIGLMCRSFGVNDVSISSVLPCKDISLNKITDEINNLLKNMSEFNSFKFIFHKIIDLNMLCHNNLHLGPVGTFLLTKHFADGFHGADWQFWPLINDINKDNNDVHQGINVVNDQAQRTLSQVLVKDLKMTCCFYVNWKKAITMD